MPFLDDTFSIVRNKSEALKLLQLFNSAYENLTFTYEAETNNSLPFLDVCVHRRSDGSLATSIHRKKTWTGVLLSFHSFVPISYKRSIIRSLFSRVVRLCSAEYLREELNFLYKIFIDNAYPPYFIDKYKITDCPNKPQVLTVERKPIWVRVPFYGDQQATYLRLSLNRIVCQNFPAAQLRIIFKTTSIPIRSPKDRLPNACSPFVVYRFLCGCGSAYYGRTSRGLAVRSREHVPKWLRQGLQGRSRSAVTSHLLECNFLDSVDLSQNFSVVCCARNDRLLRILEALHIKRFRPDLCKQKDLIIDLLLPW